MKKNTFLLLVGFVLTTLGTVEAQYNDLHDFNGAKGAVPKGSLTLSGAKLFGMTYSGGSSLDGCVFSLDTNGGGYKDILDFKGSNGEYPYYGTLVCSNGKLYGMTEDGGLYSVGCIFSIDTDGSNYKDIHDFNTTGGRWPRGSLTLSGTKLFGMTYAGGAHTNGCIFSIDTNGNGFKDFYDFNGTYGVSPTGDVTISGKVIYAMTFLGGLNGYGEIFSVDTDGTHFRDMLDFDDQTSPYGDNPYGSLLLVGGRLFGMANAGGLNNYGLIFSMDTNATNYYDLFDFNSTNGGLPQGSLAFSGGLLYGMTTYGGTNNLGCIFSMDTNATGYRVLFSFNSATCKYPFGSFVLSGKTAYATATAGGANNDGVVFSFKYIAAGLNNLAQAGEAINAYPNPTYGKFMLQSPGISDKSSVEIYNMLGEKIVSQLSIAKSSLSIDLSNQPNGIYLYRVLADNGSLMGEGKIVLSK